jgi:hypothetical protein
MFFPRSTGLAWKTPSTGCTHRSPWPAGSGPDPTVAHPDRPTTPTRRSTACRGDGISSDPSARAVRQRYEDWRLDDPAGQDLDAVRPIRDDIHVRIEQLLADLRTRQA